MIPIANLAHIGPAIADLRTLAGLTRAQLADRIADRTGTPWNTWKTGIWRWETGAVTPDLESVATVLDELGYDLALIPREEPAAPSAKCTKCGGTLSACVDCGKPAQCGEPWCARHSPDGDWSTPVPREDA